MKKRPEIEKMIKKRGQDTSKMKGREAKIDKDGVWGRMREWRR